MGKGKRTSKNKGGGGKGGKKPKTTQPSMKPAHVAPENSTSFSVAHAILHRWTPMKALGQGRQLLRRVLTPLGIQSAIFGIPALAILVVACLDFVWLQSPSGSPRWSADFTDPRRLGLVALAVVILQWGVARFAVTLSRKLREPAEPMPRVRVPWVAPLTLGLLPKAAAVGVWFGIMTIFPAELTWRSDFAFAMAAVPMLWLEARVAYWPFLIHDPQVSGPGHLLRRAWRLGEFSWGRLFTLFCLLGAVTSTLLWILASLALGAPSLLVMWLALMALVGLALWGWMFATLAWIYDTESRGPAGATIGAA